MRDLTPGQCCYEAYQAALPERMYFPAPPWDSLREPWQAAWDAAAVAVLEARASLCPICHAELARCNAKDTL